MVPENAFPVWVTCHVMLPIMAPDMPAPIMEPVESDVLPTQVPAMGVSALGLDGVDELLPQAAAERLATRPTAVSKRIA